MQINNVTRQENGSYAMKIEASEGEASYLFAFAINMLIAAGVVHLTENPDGSPKESQEVDLEVSSKGKTLN
jgi:hypothetical protein